jgi:hypothetical protein
MQTYLAELRQFGWKYAAASSTSDSIPVQVCERYHSLPYELVSFLGSFASCADPADTSWFNSFDSVRDPGEFRYNEIELMCLEAAGDDESIAALIRAFWTDHFPFFLSVAGSYQYFAYVLTGPAHGTVVYGYEPEFESPTAVAHSLSDFIAQLQAAARSEFPPYPFSHALSRLA